MSKLSNFLPKSVKIAIGVILFAMLFSTCSNFFTKGTEIYNSSVSYKLEYQQLEQNQVTTYDNYYLAFKEKSSLANINKETFIQVTNIIMSARKDGANLAWKWNQENQHIPYEEFTCFYKELSAFASTRFQENNELERSKQTVVRNHNTLLTTYPGIVYNHFIKIEMLKYKEGFVSDSTKVLFNK